MKLDGSIAAVVTGGASGLGEGTARALAARGVKVALFDLNEERGEVIDLIANGFFCTEDPTLFRPLTDSLLDHDTYMLFADFDAYVDCQHRVSEAFLDKATWHSMATRNIAKVGPFSSDRTIREYANEIWNAQPVKVELRGYDG